MENLINSNTITYDLNPGNFKQRQYIMHEFVRPTWFIEGS